MLTFLPIPENLCPRLLAIEARSNPHPWRSESLKEANQQFEHLGAFVQEELVAAVLFRQVLDETEIIHVICDKQYQGQGIAKQLMQQCIAQLKRNGGKTVFLEVRDDNDRAQRLYESLGFVTVGRRKDYYGGHCDALVQQLMLE